MRTDIRSLSVTRFRSNVHRSSGPLKPRYSTNKAANTLQRDIAEKGGRSKSPVIAGRTRSRNAALPADRRYPLVYLTNGAVRMSRAPARSRCGYERVLELGNRRVAPAMRSKVNGPCHHRATDSL